MTPLKEAWMKLYQPITENLKLDMRMNLKAKKVRFCLCSHADYCQPMCISVTWAS